jgi:putative transposase
VTRKNLLAEGARHYRRFNETDVAMAKQRFEELKVKWAAEYPGVIKVWDNNWAHIEQLFDFPAEIRRMIYTTNLIEGLNSALRKVTNGKAAFPNDSSVMKALFLRTCDLLKKWVKPVANWARVLNQLSVIFGNRITDFIN